MEDIYVVIGVCYDPYRIEEFYDVFKTIKGAKNFIKNHKNYTTNNWDVATYESNKCDKEFNEYYTKDKAHFWIKNTKIKD